MIKQRRTDNTRLIGITEKAGDSVKAIKNLFTEIMAENFSNIYEEFDI